MDTSSCQSRQKETTLQSKIELKEGLSHSHLSCQSSQSLIAREATVQRTPCHQNLHQLKLTISNENTPFKVTKVEPWKRVTLNISNDAAQRLQQLAESGDTYLRELGIGEIRFEGQQVISTKRLSPNSANINNETCNISSLSEQLNSGSCQENYLKETTTTTSRHHENSEPHAPLNGSLGDDSSNSCPESSFNSAENRNMTVAKHLSTPLQSGPKEEGNGSAVHSATQPTLPATVVELGGQKSYQHSQPVGRGNNNLSNQQQLNSNSQRPTNSNYLSGSVTSNSFTRTVRNDNSSGLVKRPVNSSHTGVALPVQQECVVNLQSLPTGGYSASIHNIDGSQLNVPRLHMLASSSQVSYVSSAHTVPQASSMQSLADSVQSQSRQVAPNSALEVRKTSQSPYDHNANYVNNNVTPAPTTTITPTSTSTLTSLTSTSSSMYQVVAPSGLQNQSSAESVTSNAANQQLTGSTIVNQAASTSTPPSQSQTQPSANSSDLLGASVDAVDDEDLLASVAATGANSIDFSNLTDLGDLNLLSVLDEMESDSHLLTSSLEQTNNASSSQQNVSEASLTSVTATNSNNTTTNALSKQEPHSSSCTVGLPHSSQSMPFALAQSHQQTTSKMSVTVDTASQQFLVNSSTGAVLNQRHSHSSMSQQLGAPVQVQAGSTLVYPSQMQPNAGSLYPNQLQQQQQVPMQRPQLVPASPRHVIVPVRQIPAVRTAAATQQVPSNLQQQQTVPMIRAIVSSGNELTSKVNSQATLLGSTSGKQLLRQPLPQTSSNATSSLSSQPQIVIRQAVQYSNTAPSAPLPSGQANQVALSSPLLVNLLQSDVQPTTLQTVQAVMPAPQSQHPHFVSQPSGAQQIRLIAPAGSHTDGAQVMMIRVSSAASDSSGQLMGSLVASLPPSQVATSVISSAEQPNSVPSQVNESAILTHTTTTTKPKKSRKPRKSKNQETIKGGDVTTTSMSQITNSIPTGTIASIPLSLASSNSSRMQATPTSTHMSAVLTFSKPSLTQAPKIPITSSVTQQQIMTTSQAGSHLLSQNQRVQPVVMIASGNGNLISSTSSAAEMNLAFSQPVVCNTSSNTTTSTFILAPVTSIGGNTISSGVCTASTSPTVQQSNNRKIILATKSNSFPVSSALSSGAIKSRLAGNNPSSTISSPSLAQSVKSTPSLATSPLPNSMVLPFTSNSSSAPGSMINVSNKSSLVNIVSTTASKQPIVSTNLTTANVISSSLLSNASIVSVPPLVTSATSMIVSSNAAVSSISDSVIAFSTGDTVALSSQSMLFSSSKLVQDTENMASVFSFSSPLSSSTNTALINKLNIPSSPILSSAGPSPMQQMTDKSLTPSATLASITNSPSLMSTDTGAAAITGSANPFSVDSFDNLLLPTEADMKPLSSSKSIPDSFKFTLDDELEGNEASKLESDFLTDDSDRIGSLSAPLSPSYFMTPSTSDLKMDSTESSLLTGVMSFNDSLSASIDTLTNATDTKDKSKELKFSTETTEQSSTVSLACSTAATTISSAAPTETSTLTSSLTRQPISMSTLHATPLESLPGSSRVSKYIDQPKSSFGVIDLNFSKHQAICHPSLPAHILDSDEEGDENDLDDFGLYSTNTESFLSSMPNTTNRGELNISPLSSSGQSTDPILSSNPINSDISVPINSSLPNATVSLLTDDFISTSAEPVDIEAATALRSDLVSDANVDVDASDAILVELESSSTHSNEDQVLSGLDHDLSGSIDIISSETVPVIGTIANSSSSIDQVPLSDDIDDCQQQHLCSADSTESVSLSVAPVSDFSGDIIDASCNSINELIENKMDSKLMDQVQSDTFNCISASEKHTNDEVFCTLVSESSTTVDTSICTEPESVQTEIKGSVKYEACTDSTGGTFSENVEATGDTLVCNEQSANNASFGSVAEITEESENGTASANNMDNIVADETFPEPTNNDEVVPKVKDIECTDVVKSPAIVDVESKVSLNTPVGSDDFTSTPLNCNSLICAEHEVNESVDEQKPSITENTDVVDNIDTDDAVQNERDIACVSDVVVPSFTVKTIVEEEGTKDCTLISSLNVPTTVNLATQSITPISDDENKISEPNKTSEASNVVHCDADHRFSDVTACEISNSSFFDGMNNTSTDLVEVTSISNDQTRPIDNIDDESITKDHHYDIQPNEDPDETTTGETLEQSDSPSSATEHSLSNSLPSSPRQVKVINTSIINGDISEESPSETNIKSSSNFVSNVSSNEHLEKKSSIEASIIRQSPVSLSFSTMRVDSNNDSKFKSMDNVKIVGSNQSFSKPIITSSFQAVSGPTTVSEVSAEQSGKSPIVIAVNSPAKCLTVTKKTRKADSTKGASTFVSEPVKPELQSLLAKSKPAMKATKSSLTTQCVLKASPVHLTSTSSSDGLSQAHPFVILRQPSVTQAVNSVALSNQQIHSDNLTSRPSPTPSSAGQLLKLVNLSSNSSQSVAQHGQYMVNQSVSPVMMVVGTGNTTSAVSSVDGISSPSSVKFITTTSKVKTITSSNERIISFGTSGNQTIYSIQTSGAQSSSNIEKTPSIMSPGNVGNKDAKVVARKTNVMTSPIRPTQPKLITRPNQQSVTLTNKVNVVKLKNDKPGQRINSGFVLKNSIVDSSAAATLQMQHQVVDSAPVARTIQLRTVANVASGTPSNVIFINPEGTQNSEAAKNFLRGLTIANHGNNSNTQVKHPIVIGTQPMLATLTPSTSQQMLVANELGQSAVFTTRTPTKTLPAILRQSKRKPESLVQPTSTNCEELQARLSKETQPSGFLAGPIEVNEQSQTMANKPTRKRVRKSKMAESNASTIEVNASLLANEHSDISDAEPSVADKQASNSRVLRNATTKSPAILKKRTQRIRSVTTSETEETLATTSEIVTEQTYEPSPKGVVQLVAKTPSKRQPARQASTNSTRQTRSNRSRAKSDSFQVPQLSNETSIAANVDQIEQVEPIKSNTSTVQVMALSMASVPFNPVAVVNTTDSSMLAANQQAIGTLPSSLPASSGTPLSSCSSSGNSLLPKRSRKTTPSISTKPSLRSNSATDINPSAAATPSKRRRVAKDLNK